MQQRVFIAHGANVTIKYIIEKGSACVEAFRDVSHRVAMLFGDPDRSRRHKELRFQKDLETLVDDMRKNKLHILTRDRFIEDTSKKRPADGSRISAVYDVFMKGAELLSESGKWSEFLERSTFDPALGQPMGDPEGADTVNPVLRDGLDDLYDDERSAPYCDGHGGLGGGDEFTTGEE